MRLLLLLLACLLLEAAGQGQQPPREAAQAAADVAALLSLPAATSNWADATRALAGSDWVNGTPCGSGTAPPWKGVTCNAARQVAEVALGGLGLQGTLPPELAALASATKLDLSRNAFNGTIPDSWRAQSNFKALEVIDLSSNLLGGPLARDLVGLATTRILLGGNRLTGELPLGWSSGTLTHLDLSYNLITGMMPLARGGMAILPAMELLQLQGNDMEGPFPTPLLGLSAVDAPVSVGVITRPVTVVVRPGNPKLAGPVAPVSPVLYAPGYSEPTADMFPWWNQLHTGRNVTNFLLTELGLFAPGAAATIGNWLGSYMQPCSEPSSAASAKAAAASAAAAGLPWPATVQTNIFDLSWLYNMSMSDLVALNPGGVAGLRPGATPALPCYLDYNRTYSRLDMAAGYYGGDVAVGAFAGGNEAALAGLEGAAGAMAACRVTASLPNQLEGGAAYSGSLSPAADGSLLEPVFWFADLQADFSVVSVMLTADADAPLTNASLYIGSNTTAPEANTLVASGLNLATAQQLAVPAGGAVGRYVLVFTGTAAQGSMSLAQVQVYTLETNAAAHKEVEVVPAPGGAAPLQLLVDGNTTTCVPLAPGTDGTATATVDLGYTAAVGSVVLVAAPGEAPGGGPGGRRFRAHLTQSLGERPAEDQACGSDARLQADGWGAQACNQTGRFVVVSISNLTASEQLCELQVGITLTPASLRAGQPLAAAATGGGSSSATSSSDSGGGLSSGAIAGIAVACALALPALLFGVAYLRWRRRWLRARQQLAGDLEKCSSGSAPQWGPPGASSPPSLGRQPTAASLPSAAHSLDTPSVPASEAAVEAGRASRLSDPASSLQAASSRGGSLGGRVALSSSVLASQSTRDSHTTAASRPQLQDVSEVQLLQKFVRSLLGAGSQQGSVLPSAGSAGTDSAVPGHTPEPSMPLGVLGSPSPDALSPGLSGTDASPVVLSGTNLAALPPAFVDDVPFEDITLLEQIGRGSFGVVYSARYCETTVAVKMLDEGAKPHLTASVQHAAVLRHLRKEALLMSRLRHPNVCMYLGCCAAPPCLVLEYCSKRSLDALLAAGHMDPKVAALLRWPRLLRLALDAAKGMLYLHKRGIVHRDLKSANLLVDGKWHAKVADFNLSFVEDPAVSGATSSLQMNNPRWMAPEVLVGDHVGTQKADVWAFGNVLWELMAWQIPFAERNMFQIINLVRQRGGDSLAVPEQGQLPAGPLGCYDQYVALMRSCWAWQPEARPDFAAIAKQLRALLNQELQAEPAAVRSSGGGAPLGSPVLRSVRLPPVGQAHLALSALMQQGPPSPVACRSSAPGPSGSPVATCEDVRARPTRSMTINRPTAPSPFTRPSPSPSAGSARPAERPPASAAQGVSPFAAGLSSHRESVRASGLSSGASSLLPQSVSPTSIASPVASTSREAAAAMAVATALASGSTLSVRGRLGEPGIAVAPDSTARPHKASTPDAVG